MTGILIKPSLPSYSRQIGPDSLKGCATHTSSDVLSALGVDGGSVQI